MSSFNHANENKQPEDLLDEESLDPNDWDAFRRLSHKVLDDALDFVHEVRERPVWQGVPARVRAALDQPVPRAGIGFQAAYQSYQDLVAPYALGNIHPRFWGWVNGTGTPMAMLSELLTATLNVNAAGFNQGSTYVELQVINWLKSLLGFPEQASGVLVSGGSLANLTALNVARAARAPFDVRTEGLVHNVQLVLYTSSETHNCVARATELMGLGSEALRVIPVKDDYTIDPDALAAAVATDRAHGYVPFCVVASAGTVNTGAIDPLVVLADFCADENLWLHVDGAYGALVALDPANRHLVAGMERADSLAIDLHKWLYQTHSTGCVLVRSEPDHRAAFATQAAYLHRLEGGVAGESISFSDYGPELSRGFRALKLWLN